MGTPFLTLVTESPTRLSLRGEPGFLARNRRISSCEPDVIASGRMGGHDIVVERLYVP
jgi:hypothetical protein